MFETRRVCRCFIFISIFYLNIIILLINRYKASFFQKEFVY